MLSGGDERSGRGGRGGAPRGSGNIRGKGYRKRVQEKEQNWRGISEDWGKGMRVSREDGQKTTTGVRLSEHTLKLKTVNPVIIREKTSSIYFGVGPDI